MNNLMERLDNLRKLIQEPDFLEGKGLSNEVNIRIFCYDPKEEMAVRHFTEKLVVQKRKIHRNIDIQYFTEIGQPPAGNLEECLLKWNKCNYCY